MHSQSWNHRTIKMRSWERGCGETQANGTGACAAVVAAVKKGLCEEHQDILVRMRGGELNVIYGDDAATLTGDARMV